MIVATNPFFRGREEFMLHHWAAYKLDCVMLEELKACLNDLPGFTRYDELYRKDITASCEACYQKGRKLVQEGERLLLSKDPVVQEDFLESFGFSEEARASRLDVFSKIESEISGFFQLYDDVLLDAGDFENMYASFFGVEDASPSPMFLELARKVMVPSLPIEAGWFPAH